MLAEQDTSYGKKSNRLFLVSLLISLLFNGLVIHYLSKLNYSITTNAFYMLINKESAFEMRIGPAYELTPSKQHKTKNTTNTGLFWCGGG